MTRRFITTLLVFVALPVLAADGRLEINQACAVQTGCFAGDAPGFPVTITTPGSYVLTGSLSVPDANTTAIDLTDTADGTSIDLNGFRIQGVTTCFVLEETCTPFGTGVGIRAAPGTEQVRVLNGTVAGMGSHGVLLQNRDLVQGVVATGNAGVGIEVGPRSSVLDSQAIGNGGAGIRVDENTTSGFLGNAGESLLRGNLATLNGIRDAIALDIEGSRSGGGNVCGDNHCSLRDARRFYLTKDLHNGAEAKSACTYGYHMASLWEIFDPTLLQYTSVPQRDVFAATQNDRGSGPPVSISAAWVRTGTRSHSIGSLAGSVNCDAYTSSSSGDDGTAVRLSDNWDAPENAFGPWYTFTISCADPLPVWCVED